MHPVEDLTPLTLRELLTLARERLGAAASGLKTRAELLAALSPPVQSEPGPPVHLEPGPPVHPERSRGTAPMEVVTRDFFRRRTE